MTRVGTVLTERGGRRRLAGMVAALAAVAAAGVGLVGSSHRASAALGLTQFEIDGNLAVNGGQDWATPAGDAPNLRDRTEKFDGCANPPLAVGDDIDRVVPGSRIADLGFNAVPVNDGSPNKKSDLCSVYQAWELVEVDDPVDGGQYEFVFYGGWTRPAVNGEIDVLFPLLGSDPNSNDDDLVVSYDFDDSSNDTVVEILAWDPAEESWLPTAALASDEFEAVTTHGDESNGVFDLTFGEFAINLTRRGILPQDGPCVTFTAGDPISRTGNSPAASLEDIVDVAPIELTNCGGLTITKQTTPAAPASSPSFSASTQQVDGEPLRTGGVALLEDVLVVPDAPSVTHLDLLISPDYVVTETGLPTGWIQSSLVCESFDPIAGVAVSRTLFPTVDPPLDRFPIAPGETASCVIENTGPPTVTVQKVTVGGAGGPFGFEVTDADGPETLSATTTAAETPTTVEEGTIEVEAGPVGVAETSVPGGFFEGSLSCTVDGDPIEGAAADLAPGQAMVCVQQNLAAAEVALTKLVDGSPTGWAFDFTIDPVPTAETATKTATAASPSIGWSDLEPGVAYTITETDVVGFITGRLSCTGGDDGVGASTFTADPGDLVECTASNVELADVSVTKGVVGTATDWSFDFTISPVPLGETATKTATAGSPNVSWNGLTPGLEHTITETPVAGFVTGTLICGGEDAVGASTFSADPGESVECAVSNTQLGSAAVTKSVAGTATNWSFDFTISPVPAGETATKAASAASPTVSWNGLVPGLSYTVAETPVAGYVTGTLNCAGGANGTGTSTFGVAPGAQTACTITNTQLASATVTKSVQPAETGWSFDFTITPVPLGESGTKTATSASPIVSWNGLIPGTSYTITELRDTDLVVGAMSCSGGTSGEGTSTFTATPGQAVACSVTNTRIADIGVVKTASPATVLPGGTVTWTIEVTNNGPSTALDVVLTDPLPATLGLVSVDAPASWNCSASVTGTPGTVSCTKPDMLPGEIWTFQVVTTVAQTAAGGTSIANVATVATATAETTTDNNTDDASIDVEQVAILPPTGGYVWDRITIGSALLAAGAGLLLATRRRRESAAGA